MNIYILDRDSIIKQRVQNMIEAGVVKPEEYEMFTKQLQLLDIDELLSVLLESHNIREQGSKCIKFYPIDIDAISKN